MAIIGFIVMFVAICWLGFMGFAMTFGTLAFSGVWKGECTVGVVIMGVALFCMVKLWEKAPFVVTITGG